MTGDVGDTSLQALMIELITASGGGDRAEFVKYVHRRLDEELDTQLEAYELIGLFAAFSGMAVRAWAEDTDREPNAVLQKIGLDLYKDDEA